MSFAPATFFLSSFLLSYIYYRANLQSFPAVNNRWGIPFLSFKVLYQRDIYIYIFLSSSKRGLRNLIITIIIQFVQENEETTNILFPLHNKLGLCSKQTFYTKTWPCCCSTRYVSFPDLFLLTLSIITYIYKYVKSHHFTLLIMALGSSSSSLKNKKDSIYCSYLLWFPLYKQEQTRVFKQRWLWPQIR